MSLISRRFSRRAGAVVAALTALGVVAAPAATAQITLPDGLEWVGSSDVGSSVTGSMNTAVSGTESAPRAPLPGWKEIFVDDFTTDAPVGSFANDECDNPRKVVYTGTENTRWTAYPECYTDTFNSFPYRADEVLSVHDGALDYNLHEVDGKRAGANLSPLVSGDDQAQLYGRYSARIKVSNPFITGYRLAMLLWPDSEVWPTEGELNFPEGELTGPIRGYHHFAEPDATANSQAISEYDYSTFTDWRVVTTEWTPTTVRYILDGKVLLESQRGVPNTPMRWQLQLESSLYPDLGSGNFYVDWVTVHSWDGAQ
ncbi:glycoside hydrolase family 16 protein [Rhodococcus sp. NPDC003318]|uniref:glycoside hydrolase family 16 protein n=1 Tax=Rhodococcus sp. NPDC003318 TaxID=3364503 RepID=UPI0036ACEB12